jgi:hypothetical protein
MAQFEQGENHQQWTSLDDRFVLSLKKMVTKWPKIWGFLLSIAINSNWNTQHLLHLKYHQIKFEKIY